ncbi:hypothetical protein BH09ACT8_BH09ACT8_14810 [soil metagenome]
MSCAAETDSASASASAEQALIAAAHEAEGTETNAVAASISRWVDEAAEQFSDAPVQAFVPILVEDFVRGRWTPHAHANPA